MRRKSLPLLQRVGIIVGILAAIFTIVGISITNLSDNSLDYSRNNLQLTVLVSDEQGNIILENEGEIVIDLGNDRRVAAIGEHGRTNFGEIPNTFKGKKIQIGFSKSGFETIENTTEVIFTGTPIKLHVRRDVSLGVIKGSVQEKFANGSYLEKVEVRINNDTILYTDGNGNINVILPVHMRTKNSDERYKLVVVKEGYEKVVEYYSPLSNPFDIRLDTLQ